MYVFFFRFNGWADKNAVRGQGGHSNRWVHIYIIKGTRGPVLTDQVGK